MLKIYNTYSRQLEEFTPLNKDKVLMYTCGPTVYGRPHIGNFSAYLMADLLRRWLEVSGHNVLQVTNITDVGHLVADAEDGEDKLEKQAKHEQIDPLEIASKYAEMYLEDEAELNILPSHERPKASEHVAEMITMTEALLEKGLAYETDDGVYFDVAKFERYGQLSGNKVKNLTAGARVDINECKHSPVDFALWKKLVGTNAHHILKWPSPWGEGFPGWHIECSAMSHKHLGEQIDIHTGGEDNIFPHHECEIAQSEGVSGKQFCKYWLHKRHIDLGDIKMSKSLGNVIDVPMIKEKGFNPLDFRYLMMSVHYRTKLKFEWKGMEDAKKARKKINDWFAEHQFDVCMHCTWPVQFSDDLNGHMTKFLHCMNDDLNTSGALAAVFECMAWSRNKDLTDDEHASLHHFMQMVNYTFGCFEAPQKLDLPEKVLELLDMRKQAREDKDFAKSDELRDALAALGYNVLDTSGGQEVETL